MKLYLVRHAEAKGEREDPERGLTLEGLADIERTATLAARAVAEYGAVPEILHSTKKRAQETAKVLARHLSPARGIAASDGLLPMDEPSIWQERVFSGREGDLMLVGHMPHMGRLAALLVTGDDELDVVAFRTATMVCLEQTAATTWCVAWMVSPDVAR